MSRFAHVLRRVERELPAWEPVRSETLLELGADLEDAYQAYRAQGLGEREAAQRAETLLTMDAVALSELRRLHSPWYARLLTPDSREALVQRMIFVLLSAAVILGGLSAVIASDLLRKPPATVWMLAGFGVAIAVSVMTGWLKARAGHVEGLMRSLRRVMVLCAAQLIIAAIAATRMIAAISQSVRERSQADVMGTIGSAAELLTLSLSVCLAAFVTAFLLHRKSLSLQRLRHDLDRLLAPSRGDSS